MSDSESAKMDNDKVLEESLLELMREEEEGNCDSRNPTNDNSNLRQQLDILQGNDGRLSTVSEEHTEEMSKEQLSPAGGGEDQGRQSIGLTASIGSQQWRQQKEKERTALRE